LSGTLLLEDITDSVSSGTGEAEVFAVDNGEAGILVVGVNNEKALPDYDI
jgi:hypothetical protein